ncbi:dynamin family protein [Pseudonocardia hierapolitana]|uniref:Dynamin family protein n=1 Tax=Pseudonocardia hierapolitana TaxID=1128676 RepID=A0A561SY38_9PSEU|nr:dynamin family protein [Pseudonocardia hierapolitana]TWF79788.1 dynamin family protein [Pseudonocardia hierapolitana]
MPPGPGPLTAAVVDLAAIAERSYDPRLAEVGRRCLDRLRIPLSIALVGRVSTGKSTLLNALLGRKMAPTDGRECTQIVYVFRYDPHTTATLVSRAGSERTTVDLDDRSRLPADFDLPASEISYIDVTMPLPLLEEVTLLDTPGLASAETQNSAATERMLHDTEESAARADALLFCVNGPIREDEAAAVRAFSGSRGAKRLSGATAIGILTRADQVAQDPLSSWTAATGLARDMAARNTELFSTVVPVVGLLAETAETGALREPHARALGELARAWSPDVAHDALASPMMFREEGGPVEGPVRTELLDLLGQFGVGRMLDRIRSGTRPDVVSLTREAAAASGLAAMRTQIRRSLGSRSDVLKASGALEELMESAYDAGDRSLYDAAQSMLDRPEMFPLKVIGMGRQLATGEVKPPAGLVEQAWITVQTGLPRTTKAEASRAAAEWKRWAELTDSAGQRLARVMVRAWQLAAESKSGEGPP